MCNDNEAGATLIHDYHELYQHGFRPQISSCRVNHTFGGSLFVLKKKPGGNR